MTMHMKPISSLKTIAFANQKGGVGKTLASLLSSLALNHLNISVELVDNDVDQQTATECWAQIEKKAIDSKPTMRIIDTPPDLKKKGFVESIKHADLIVVVSSPSPADLWSSKRTITEIRKYTEKPVYLLFNKIRKNTVFSNFDHLEKITLTVGATPLNATLGLRECYQHALVQGWNGLDLKARDEVSRLVTEILTKMP
jgi:chromosome partitioning protein